MKLRMVCNHPDLFEPRPVSTPFQCDAMSIELPNLIFHGAKKRMSVAPLPELCLGPASGAFAFDSKNDSCWGIADREFDLMTSPACCRECLRVPLPGLAGCASPIVLPVVVCFLLLLHW